MERIFFQRASSGFRTVQGELIKRLQIVLRNEGFYQGIIDGIYGNKTELALMSFQQHNNLVVSGKVDDITWSRVFLSAGPNIKDRCLQVTADFEGTGFSKIVGNFDGAGLTWGIIGFTLFNGQLQGVLNEILANHEAIFRAAFGNLTGQMLQVLKKSLAKQMEFANMISIGTSQMKVLDEWSDAFVVLGDEPVVQEIQLRHTGKYFDIALRDINRLSVTNELGLALCFDIAVQNGGIDNTEFNRIQSKIAQSPPTTPQDLRIIIANVVAENSKPRFVEDVRKRKMTFATGTGAVHGAQYNVKSWGLDEFPIL
jgi:hypothetical protein